MKRTKTLSLGCIRGEGNSMVLRRDLIFSSFTLYSFSVTICCLYRHLLTKSLSSTIQPISSLHKTFWPWKTVSAKARKKVELFSPFPLSSISFVSLFDSWRLVSAALPPPAFQDFPHQLLKPLLQTRRGQRLQDQWAAAAAELLNTAKLPGCVLLWYW